MLAVVFKGGHRAAAHFVQVLVQVIDGFGKVLQLLVQMPQVQLLLPFLQRHFLTLQAFEQFVEVDGLLVVIRNARSQRLDHVLLVSLAGQHDRFERPLAPGNTLHGLHQLDAIHVRHMQVAQHQANFSILAETP